MQCNTTQHNISFSFPAHLTSPQLTSPQLTSPHLTSPHLTSFSPHLILTSSRATRIRTHIRITGATAAGGLGTLEAGGGEEEVDGGQAEAPLRELAYFPWQAFMYVSLFIYHNYNINSYIILYFILLPLFLCVVCEVTLIWSIQLPHFWKHLMLTWRGIQHS